jgi:hypothetical protein
MKKSIEGKKIHSGTTSGTTSGSGSGSRSGKTELALALGGAIMDQRNHKLTKLEVTLVQ